METNQEYQLEVKRMLLQMSVWNLALCGSAMLAGWTVLVPGFIVGMVGSYLYFLLMCYRVKTCTDIPMHKAVVYMRIGWVIRLVFIILVLILAVHVPLINFWAAVTGLFTFHIVIVLNAFVTVLRGLFRTG